MLRIFCLSIFIFLISSVAFTFLANRSKPALAQVGNTNCYNAPAFRRLDGLLSTPTLENNSHGKFGNPNGQCVVDSIQAGIVSFKIPTYSELKNTYFERKNSVSGSIDKETMVGNVTQLHLNGGGGGCGGCDRLWNITGNLILVDPTDLQAAANQRGVIFIDGNLNIGDMNAFDNNPGSRAPVSFTYGNQNSGIVFIVSGDVKFGRNVHQFDGIIISQGVVCTSADHGGFCLSDKHSDTDPGGETKQLIINGNIVSLNSTNPIKFERDLIFSTVAFPDGNDTTPAEVVNVQPKYLVIMKDLLSETFTIKTEDTRYAQNQ